jgi:hypothetical protein
MALTHTTAIRNAIVDYVCRTQLPDGTTNARARIQITKTNDDYTAGELLAVMDFTDDPPFPVAASGFSDASNPPFEDSNADNSGTATQFRTVDRDVVEVFKGTVTATGGGGDMELSSTLITAGDAVRINSFRYTAPN